MLLPLPLTAIFPLGLRFFKLTRTDFLHSEADICFCSFPSLVNLLTLFSSLETSFDIAYEEVRLCYPDPRRDPIRPELTQRRVPSPFYLGPSFKLLAVRHVLPACFLSFRCFCGLCSTQPDSGQHSFS